MKWKKFTLTTTTEAVDLVSSMLDDVGIEGIEVEDNVPLTEKETKGMFIDILPELPPDEGVAKVSFYLDDDDQVEEMLRRVNEGLDELAAYTELGQRTIEASETEDKDWINNWKQYFKPFTVDHILIKPTWETVPEEHKDKLLVQIDPGTAFGTGMHETTQLCIRQLEKYVHSESEILDVGTGSGILGITALKLGAKEVWGTDLDENAITAVGENLASNDISSDRFHVLQGNIIDDKSVQDWAGYEKYDIVVANILADVIIMLVKEIPVHLKKGGYFITSGIINLKEEAVRAAFAASEELEVVEITYQGEWLSVTARKKLEFGMHHFFVDPSSIEEGIVRIVGTDLNHMKNVLRMKPGEEVLISDGTGKDYNCQVKEYGAEEGILVILSENADSRELPSRIWLFQGLPKSDKMEVILQKAVELGAAGVIPVATRNAVVKLDAKKAEAKIRRWQAIAESAAKQSKRSYIPQVGPVMSLKEAFSYIEEQKFDLRMIPYELEKGMDGTKTVLEALAPGQQVAVFIGPEGGFDEEEIQLALKMGVKPVSLGKRILRTETAGPAILALLMMKLEGAF